MYLQHGNLWSAHIYKINYFPKLISLQFFGLKCEITVNAATQIINEANSMLKPSQLEKRERPIKLKEILAILNKYEEEETWLECFDLKVLEICLK